MSGVTLFKSQEDFYRRNKATMKTSRALTEEAERGAVDLRYAYKLLPPGSKNFYAKAWEQTWGSDALMYNAKRVDSKRPVIEKINLDQPETGSLPTSAPKNGLGSEGLICDTLVGDSADSLRTALFSQRLRNPISAEDEDDEEEHPDDDSVEGGEEKEDALLASAVALADGDAATGEAAWGPAPGDNASALSGGRYGRSAIIRGTGARPPPSVKSERTGASGKTGGRGGSAASRVTPVSARSVGSARSLGGLSKGTSSGESYTSDDGPGAPPPRSSGPKAESDPRSGGGGGGASASASAAAAAAAAPAKARNIPKATAYPAANALAKKVRAAKGEPPEGMAAELKAIPRREQNRFHKWAKASGYE